METIHSIIRIKFYFIVRNKNKFNGIKSSIIYYNLDLYLNNREYEGRIGLFNSYTCSVEGIEKFYNCYAPFEVTTTQNEVNFYARYFE